RDLAEAVAAAGPFTRGCGTLVRAADRAVRADLDEAEGVDRPSPPLLARGVARAPAARAALARGSHVCGGGPVVERPTIAELLAPRSAETFTGRVRARVPPRATSAQLLVNGRVVRRFP